MTDKEHIKKLESYLLYEYRRRDNAVETYNDACENIVKIKENIQITLNNIAHEAARRLMA